MLKHTYDHYAKIIADEATVIAVKDPIVIVFGFQHAKLEEIVIFSSGYHGQVFAIEKDSVSIVLLEQQTPKVGDRLTRTNTFPMIPVGDMLSGHIINPLGFDLLDGTQYEATEKRNLEAPPLGIESRIRIKQFLPTGVSIVDLMIPLGKGQKELIIGDRKTGKSTFVLTVMKRQLQENTKLIYVAIGKKASALKSLQEKIHKTIGDKNCIIVATTAIDSPGMIYLTPFAGMTLAEYFRDQGQDVLLVIDDLSTHANFYRETSLIAKSFPGRDSYPGDIFYTHARLLERAGNFSHSTKGEVAITCLPFVETVEGDLTSFVATNLMGITDGHIFFDSELFYKGKRPGINPSLSVSRVGRQTQTDLARAITWEITSFMSSFESIQNLSHFGSELHDNVKDILTKGNLLYSLFHQHEDILVPQEVQLVLFALIWLSDQGVQEKEMEQIKTRLTKRFEEKKTQTLFATLFAAKSLTMFFATITQYQEKIHALWQD